MSKTTDSELGAKVVLIIAGMLGAFVVLFVDAWWLMILLGIMHLDVSASVPALGFFQTVVTGITLTTLGAFFLASQKVTKK